MKKMQKMAVSVLASLLIGVMFLPVTARADRCLVVYPEALSEYHYDVNEYYTVSFGDPLYDPMYDRGGDVLIDFNSNEIALDIYQAPNLAGFIPSMNGQEGYFTIGNQFTLIIDGFYNQPTTYENIILMFESDPNWCTPTMSVDGVPVAGTTCAVGNLAVSTPMMYGNNYSDILTLDFSWAGCYGVRIWAYADENYNGVLDGGECFTSFSHDVTVPAQDQSWGSIKARYSE